jgi:4-amino-4-deoxy-L-arabinose transferase-like glycosyltransferase
MTALMAKPLPARGAGLLVALVLGLLLFRLGAVPLLGPDEPRYTRVAVEMHRSGEWVTPTLQGRPWLEKPALFYWMAGAFFSVLGETETAARLPSVLATLVFVAATALVGARLLGSSAGLHAGFVLGTSLLTFAYGRAAAMDMLLAATVTAAIGLLGLRVLGIAGGMAIPAAYGLMGLGVLAKGPLGVLLPGLVIAGYIVATREWEWLGRLAPPRALLVFMLVAGPWYALILRAQGREFVDVFLLGHNVARFTSTVHNHPGPFFYYVPVILLGLFPWSGLLVPALARLRPGESRADLLLLVWTAVPLAFFSVAGSKLPGYILPVLAPLAILMGRAAARLLEDRTWSRAAALVTVVLGALVAAGPAFLRARGEPDWAITLPVAFWVVAMALLFSSRVAPDPAGALSLLRVGAAGFLLLLGFVAPSILDRLESGRRLFVPAHGREVLAWGAWRTAWMAGYFYNDGKVREVFTASEVIPTGPDSPTLVIAGPAERRQLEALPTVAVHPLAQGPRGNSLLRLDPR